MTVTGNPPVLGVADIANPRAQPAINQSPALDRPETMPQTSIRDAMQSAPESGKGMFVDKKV